MTEISVLDVQRKLQAVRGAQIGVFNEQEAYNAAGRERLTRPNSVELLQQRECRALLSSMQCRVRTHSCMAPTSLVDLQEPPVNVNVTRDHQNNTACGRTPAYSERGRKQQRQPQNSMSLSEGVFGYIHDKVDEMEEKAAVLKDAAVANDGRLSMGSFQDKIQDVRPGHIISETSLV